MSGPSTRDASGQLRMPAEWEPHAATWIAWPHNLSDWPGKFAPVPWVYGEIARKICPGEKVRILVDTEAAEGRARRILTRAGAVMEQIEFHRIPTDRVWTRDYGPLFIRRESPPHELAIAGFAFNAWAKYPDFHNDAMVAQRIAKASGRRLVPAQFNGRTVVLEGGSIDVNGRGSLLTTEECLLDAVVQARNPGLGRREIEGVLRETLDARNVLWLGKGICGDDTHGHVDDLCRFVGPRTVVLCRETDPEDANYRPLEENRERLEGFHLEDGGRPEVVPLPLPAPLFFDGRRLPASYANFYIANRVVLVPTFNDPNDRAALGVLSECFPGRHVLGIHAVDLVWGLGTLHCLTQQEPDEEASRPSA
jgi:agmatine deiminase